MENARKSKMGGQETSPNNRPKAKGIVEMLRTSFGLHTLGNMYYFNKSI
jgi:hypothetical protein